MEYATVLRRFGSDGSFELPSLLAFTGEKRATVLQTLYRWNQKGWIIPIRRGLYTFPDDLAKNSLTAERAANQIQQDSYVTGLWLLNQIGLIPEGVTVVTSATRKNPAEFETRIGRFAYQHIQEQGFFGYEERQAEGGSVRVALPEKALLDFFWWKNTEWTETEFARWRLQDPFKRINHKRLQEFAKRWNKPRLIRAAANVTAYLKTPTKPVPQEPLHRRVLAPIIRAQVARIKREDRKMKRAILAMKEPTPFTQSYLENIEAREERRFLESLGLKGDESSPKNRQ